MKSINGLFKVRVKPEGSQAYLVVLLTGGVASLITSFIFIWYDKPNWTIPLYVGLGCIAFSALGWFLSRKDVDLRDAEPTKISIRANGFDIEADARVRIDQEILQDLARQASIVANRKPLPESSGLIDGRGNPVLGSSNRANEKISELNKIAKEQVEAIERLLDSRRKDHKP
ncbi:hypothetical protein [Pseudomonas sp. Marseille-QA0892]